MQIQFRLENTNANKDTNTNVNKDTNTNTDRDIEDWSYPSATSCQQRDCCTVQIKCMYEMFILNEHMTCECRCLWKWKKKCKDFCVMQLCIPRALVCG